MTDPTENSVKKNYLMVLKIIFDKNTLNFNCLRKTQTTFLVILKINACNDINSMDILVCCSVEVGTFDESIDKL